MSHPRGYFKSVDGVFAFSPKITTIGQENCDFIIQNVSIDPQHATLEFSEIDDAYIIKDLDTKQGTYVNDCRVQNAAVRLAVGDIVKFGLHKTAYEFTTDPHQQATQMHYPSMSHRNSWQYHQSPIISADSSSLTQTQQQLYTQNTRTASGGSHHSPLPAWVGSSQPGRTGSVTSQNSTTRLIRPMSAGSARRGLVPSPAAATHSGHSSRGGWVSGPVKNADNPGFNSPTTETMLLQEKERKILSLQSELDRLRMMEEEYCQKDAHIHHLENQVTQLSSMGDPDLRNRLQRLDQEVANKKNEVNALREQLQQMQQESAASVSAPRSQDISDQMGELQREVEKARKDKQITGGLVSQLQRDLSNKDATISRLTRDIESIKKDMNEKDITIAAIQAKFSRIKESKRGEEEREAREKELIAVRQKFKAAESKVHDQTSLIAELKENLESVRVSEHRSQEEKRKVKEEVEQIKGLYEDMQRTERVARVDMQEATKKYERLRNRVMQVAFSTPGVKAPDDEIKDDQLIDLLRKVIDERTQFHQNLAEMKAEVQKAGSARTDMEKAVKKLKLALEDANTRLTSKGRLRSVLRDEISLLSSQPVDELVIPIKEVLLVDLQHQHHWQNEIELAVEECGVSTKLSSESTGTLIRSLKTKMTESVEERDRLKSRLGQVEGDHRSDMEKLKASLDGDAESRVKEAVEKTKIEDNEAMQRAIEEVSATEKEKFENAMAAESNRRLELEESIANLQKALVDRQTVSASRAQEAQDVMDQLNEKQMREEELIALITAAEAARDEAIASVTEQVRQAEIRCGRELEEYKEAARQHSKTICAMEERLNKVIKENKELKTEVNQRKKECMDLHEKLSKKNEVSVPKEPKVIVQQPSVEIATLERNILALRQENASLKKQIHDHDDVVASLKRDIVGAEARFSDIRGELSESQKEEVAILKSKLNQTERSLMDEKSNIAKILENFKVTKETLANKEAFIEHLREDLYKQKTAIDDRDSRITDLENQIERDQEKWASQLAKYEQDGQITSELTAMGAQCRGERHHQVIHHQKEAMIELRKRLKLFDTTKSSAPSRDQAVQQVILLKKELAELRTRIAMDDINKSLSQTGSLKNIADGNVGNANFNMTIQEEQEKTDYNINSNHLQQDEDLMNQSAVKEFMDSLETSEQTFQQLLRQMASQLEMENIQGLRSMSGLSREEREKLRDERNGSTTVLSQRIRILKERLQRKEELLIGYEQDLAKLKQAEELASRKDNQVEGLIRDIRMKTEETELLRESLNKTKEMLNQEKRLNVAIKQKKPYIPDAEALKSKPKAKFHCPPDDIFGKQETRQKGVNEKMKRKDYEIKSLKSELTSREKDLCQASARMANLESSLVRK